MTEKELKDFYDRVQEEARAAVAQAIERHRKLEEPIAIWRDGKVVVLSAGEFVHPQPEQ